MASLAVDQPQRARAETPTRAATELIDSKAIVADLEDLVEQ